MQEVFDQYGGYIIAVISAAVVVGAVTVILGVGGSDPSVLGIRTNFVDSQFGDFIQAEGTGTGIFGKLICLLLNRCM